MAQETRSFQAEVSRLLDIVAHSLYSEKEIFLRELISNASDACDRLRYLALTEPALIADDPELRVTLTPDKEKRTLTIADNGIGMNRQEMIDNLGTIARSGTAAFVEGLSGDSKKDMALIGQFGVGFYSAFMVAEKVEVVARKAGEQEAWRWTSDGRGEFAIEPAEKAGRGTIITLSLREDDKEYTEAFRLRGIVRKYSEHIPLPIMLEAEGKTEKINEASALWTRPKAEITDAQYLELYHQVAHQFDDPWLTMHSKAEGTLEYTSLLFIPSTKPPDLYEPDRKPRLKLYVRRVFISDDVPGLLPPYLRFLRGIVDSEDLPLNVSREMLQNNPMLQRMRGQITRRVLSELDKKAKEAAGEYAQFWNNFGAVVKEGIYEDFEHRDQILPLVRFHTTAGEGLVSFDDYVSRMKPGQEAIYTISGGKLDILAKSPQLEGYRARGVEVLLLTDPVDEFWMPSVHEYQKHPFKSVTQGSDDLDKIPEENPAEPENKPASGEMATLIALFKTTLGDKVKDVRTSSRLTESAVCLIADINDMDLQLERMMKAHNRLANEHARILEINPKHPLIRRLGDLASKKGASVELQDFAWLLFDQARLLEGEALPDPAAFAQRMSAVLERKLA